MKNKLIIVVSVALILLFAVISVQGLGANTNLQRSFSTTPIEYTSENMFSSFNLTNIGRGMYILKASGRFSKQSNYAAGLILNNICNANGLGYGLTSRQLVFSSINRTSTDGSWSIDKTVNLARFNANDLSHLRLAVNELSLTGAASSGAVNICLK